MRTESSGTRQRWLRFIATADATVDNTVALLRGRPALDRIAYGVSEAANHSILWHAINTADLGFGIATSDHRRSALAIRRSVVQATEQLLVNGPLKSSVRRQRPAVNDSHAHRLRTPLTSSFPSGHATAGACAAELLDRDLGHRRTWWALAAVVGWSRVHVGVHHPSDVLAGWVIGAGAARLAGQIWPPSGVRDNAADRTRTPTIIARRSEVQTQPGPL